MKKKRPAKAARSDLLPTNAHFPFYDPRQLEAREPRQGRFEGLFKGALQQRVSDRAIKIERAQADVQTEQLQAWIDLFTVELLRRALAGEDDAITLFAHKVGGLVRRLEDLTRRQREKTEKAAAISPFWSVNVTQRNTDFS